MKTSSVFPRRTVIKFSSNKAFILLRYGIKFTVMKNSRKKIFPHKKNIYQKVFDASEFFKYESSKVLQNFHEKSVFLSHSVLLKMNFLLLQSIWLWFNSYCWFPRQISQFCHLLNDDGYKKKCKHKKIYKLQIFILKAHFRAYTTIFLFPFLIFFSSHFDNKRRIKFILVWNFFIFPPTVVAPQSWQ